MISEKSTNLNEAFTYPITSLTLSIAFPGSSLHQADKIGFGNCTTKTSNSVYFCFPPNTKWIHNGMAAMRVLGPRQKYLNWCIELLRYIISPENANVTSVEIWLICTSKKVFKKERGNKEEVNRSLKFMYWLYSKRCLR